MLRRLGAWVRDQAQRVRWELVKMLIGKRPHIISDRIEIYGGGRGGLAIPLHQEHSHVVGVHFFDCGTCIHLYEDR